MFPHVAKLEEMPYKFKTDFGLTELPTEPGILLIRGARQYGKSTWLEQEMLKTIQKFGAGTAYYLNGENIATSDILEQKLDILAHAFSQRSKVNRILLTKLSLFQTGKSH